MSDFRLASGRCFSTVKPGTLFLMRERTSFVLLQAGIAACVVILSASGLSLGAEVDSAAAAPTNQTSDLQATNPPGVSTNRDVIQQAIEELRREAEPVPNQPLEPSSLTNGAPAPDRPRGRAARRPRLGARSGRRRPWVLRPCAPRARSDPCRRHPR